LLQEFDVMLCWLNNLPARPGAKFLIRHTTNLQKAIVKEVVYKIDINTYNRLAENQSLSMNDIARVRIRCNRPLMKDSYRENRSTGSITLIDENTNNTVAAGMIL